MMRVQTSFLSRCILGQAMGSKTFMVRPSRAVRVIASGVHTSSGQRRTAVPGASQKPQLVALKERGLINTAVLRHVKSPGVKSLDINHDGKQVNITWSDGHASRFHATWLRHSCHCPECRLDHNGMICSQPEHIDLGIKVLSAEIEDGEVLVLQWQHSEGDIHEGPIPLAWLRSRCSSSEKERRQARAMTFFKDVSTVT
ncbi:gamma-butyrobetaine dioxygenase [Elysia marginata]|uniref:Gamma-butyrobetaine dioxygenase n=1 Tax=Elysia marginata TaxID=1093978 RepID=A0AAV4G0I6_9GAST|nr:gamma-butyrobetaine dioxygenase [Elysia marginata]